MFALIQARKYVASPLIDNNHIELTFFHGIFFFTFLFLWAFFNIMIFRLNFQQHLSNLFSLLFLFFLLPLLLSLFNLVNLMDHLFLKHGLFFRIHVQKRGIWSFGLLRYNHFGTLNFVVNLYHHDWLVYGWCSLGFFQHLFFRILVELWIRVKDVFLVLFLCVSVESESVVVVTLKKIFISIFSYCCMSFFLWLHIFFVLGQFGYLRLMTEDWIFTDNAAWFLEMAGLTSDARYRADNLCWLCIGKDGFVDTV